MAKLSTTRLITPSSDGMSGRSPRDRQRKKARSCPTSTSSTGAAVVAHVRPSPGRSTTRSSARNEVRRARRGPTITLRAPELLAVQLAHEVHLVGARDGVGGEEAHDQRVVVHRAMGPWRRPR